MKTHFLQFTVVVLTFLRKVVVFTILKVNKPIVPQRGVLPVASKKGIITLTLVISRMSIKPAVTRGFYVIMFNIFRVKTKLQLQLEEYIEFKSKSSPFIAKDHQELLRAFIKEVHHTNINEITPEEIEAHHKRMLSQKTQYLTVKTMQAIRALMRFHKHDTNIVADDISNTGMADMQNVGKNVPIPPITRPKRGRPMNVELVKKVKILKDKGGLSYRQISKAIGKDVKNVYLMYNYDIPLRNVGNKVIPK